MTPEQALLGSMLVSEECADDILGLIEPDDFASSNDSSVFRAIRYLRLNGHASDVVSVRSVLERKEPKVDSGYPLTLMDYADARKARTYAAEVSERSRIRKLSRACSEGQAAIASGVDSDTVAHSLSLAVDGGTRTAVARSVTELAQERCKTLTDKQAYYWLKDYSVHFYAGDFIPIGARPSVGKSALALQWAFELSERNVHTRVYSYEMNDRSLVDRLIQSRTPFTRHELDDGLSDDGAKFVTEALASLPDSLTIVDAARITFEGLVSDIRAFARHGGKVVFIDYLQLVTKQTYEDVTEASRRLKLLAGECGVVLFALSQFSRSLIGSDGKERPPSLGDFRQSGAIEQDADDAILLSRVPPESREDLEANLKRKGYLLDRPDTELVCIHFAKTRNTAPFRAYAYFDGEDMTFHTLDRTSDGRPL